VPSPTEATNDGRVRPRLLRAIQEALLDGDLGLSVWLVPERNMLNASSFNFGAWRELCQDWASPENLITVLPQKGIIDTLQLKFTNDSSMPFNACCFRERSCFYMRLKYTSDEVLLEQKLLIWMLSDSSLSLVLQRSSCFVETPIW